MGVFAYVREFFDSLWLSNLLDQPIQSMVLFIVMFLASPFTTPFFENNNYLIQKLEQQQPPTIF